MKTRKELVRLVSRCSRNTFESPCKRAITKYFQYCTCRRLERACPLHRKKHAVREAGATKQPTTSGAYQYYPIFNKHPKFNMTLPKLEPVNQETHESCSRRKDKCHPSARHITRFSDPEVSDRMSDPLSTLHVVGNTVPEICGRQKLIFMQLRHRKAHDPGT